MPHPRSSRSSNWWNSRRSQSAGHWLQSGSRDRRSTTGTVDTRRAGSKLWWMASRDRGGSGTKSLTRSKRRSSIWPLRSRTCRRGLGRAFPPALLTLARVRLQRLSPIGNRRNRPAAAENAAHRSSASVASPSGRRAHLRDLSNLNPNIYPPYRGAPVVQRCRRPRSREPRARPRRASRAPARPWAAVNAEIAGKLNSAIENYNLVVSVVEAFRDEIVSEMEHYASDR